MSESFLRSAITEALPDLPEVSKDILQETLQSLGIETHDDFQFVKEEDLLSALRPIQARKLVAAWSLKCQAQESASSSLTASPGPYPSVMCESPISTSSSSSGQSPQGSFPDSFVIPWRKFPEDLTQALERGKRPGPSLRKEMRQEVNQGKDVKYLLENWPYWFCEIGMAVHFNELTGVDLKETFLKNMEQKGERLLHFMKTVAVNKSKRFYQAATKLQMMRGEHPGYTHATEMVLLLLAYFDEKEDVMFHYVEDTCLAGEVDLNSVPLTPTIVVCGQSCYSSGRMMLSVDQVIVNENISSFISALCMMFGSYYCFNIHYPSTLASTLEFLQRCFFSINPEKGTKVEQTKTKRLHVNPRVLTLIQDLSDHEWRAI
ncbi:uncharacterized protein LOC118557809 isoform X3 [Fundulus heteroclitus]|uniref:uncharacterized protein LOC118556749 isoform X2 n=1 Tax=Fundulus heteroclitus TaxID=8078 RepID=UPI00165BD9C5|nr:uncharacterized protein LOC118556749 isoform X2 [Fundulus heteroclitus]XP_035984089.1 uncharacterized protein LOC118557809 isoform X3 [Fundulus heteroclitus]